MVGAQREYSSDWAKLLTLKKLNSVTSEGEKAQFSVQLILQIDMYTRRQSGDSLSKIKIRERGSRLAHLLLSIAVSSAAATEELSRHYTHIEVYT